MLLRKKLVWPHSYKPSSEAPASTCSFLVSEILVSQHALRRQELDNFHNNTVNWCFSNTCPFVVQFTLKTEMFVQVVLERESIRTLCDKLRRERDRAVSGNRSHPSFSNLFFLEYKVAFLLRMWGMFYLVPVKCWDKHAHIILMYKILSFLIYTTVYIFGTIPALLILEAHNVDLIYA